MQKLLKSSALIFTLLLSSTLFAANIDQLIRAGESRIDAGAQAQKQIIAMAEETDDMIAEYKQALKVLDGLNIYNDLQRKQIANQEAEKANLTESIDKVGSIEQQIVPLMVKMVESLRSFIEADVPFLQEERFTRMEKLEGYLESPSIGRAEKLRQVLEAYSIETDYGNTIESYRDKINLDGKEMEVDFLRIGRITLAYQSDDGSQTGAWNKETKSYEKISDADYKAQVDFGLKVAAKEISPDLFIVPVQAAKGAK